MKPEGEDVNVQGSLSRSKARFAWFPKKLTNGKWIWLVTYRVSRQPFFND